MTRAERRQAFIDGHKHELAGHVLDAAIGGRSGAELALWLRGVMKLMDARLAAIFDELVPAHVQQQANEKGKAAS